MSDDHKSLVRRSIRPQSASRPLVTPIYPSTAYASDTPDMLDAQYAGEIDGFTYSREGHPNAKVLADKIDWMEGVTGGMITGSGMAAVTAAVMGTLGAGDHIIASDQLYGRSLRLLTQDLPRFGMSSTLADATNAGALEAAITPNTKAILLEVVSNPGLRIADVTGIAQIAQQHGLVLIVDNTFTTPRGFQPHAAGADIIVHSITKLLGGHSDVMLGYVSAKDPTRAEAIRDVIVTWGLTPSPYECWLAERGIYSFDLRYERAQSNAADLADFLAGLPGVDRVLYPGRNDHPDHNRAAAVLGENFGNMVSFSLKGGRKAANTLTKAAPHIAFAPTLGDIGTTLSHPASSSHRGLTPVARESLGLGEGFFRISVGIEDIALLKSEFKAAIAAVNV